MAVVPAFCTWMRVQRNVCANWMVARFDFFGSPVQALTVL